MRLASTPDSSRLVLQSLLPSGAVSAGTTTQGGEGSTDPNNTAAARTTKSLEKYSGRRYSGAQSGPAGDPADVRDSHTDQLLQMFSSTLHTSPASYSRGSGQGELVPLDETSSASSTGGLHRQGSSPVLSSLAHQPISVMQGYLKRRASASALYTVSESNTSNSVAPVPQSSLSSSSTDTHSATTGALQRAEPFAPAVTNTTPAGPNSDPLDAPGTKSKGFGILSRTRQFGAWLGRVTHGEKVEVSKKDLNVFAPTSF
ncbi:hypothetical protein ElyMa_002661300 [Elysia marginata]|uniref:Uncharacterized protein n=1 Tax=Elysia marginata TaxID=1093978 RepID=A0AAV4H9E3_9GAST|nr:hypothetical protein ElyMa_002661300 [Elysia marginata]